MRHPPYDQPHGGTSAKPEAIACIGACARAHAPPPMMWNPLRSSEQGIEGDACGGTHTAVATSVRSAPAATAAATASRKGTGRMATAASIPCSPSHTCAPGERR